MPLIHLRKPQYPRPRVLGITGTTCALLLGLLVYLTPPLNIAFIILFHVLLFVGLFGIGAFVLNNNRHGVLIASATTLYFLLRYLHFRSPFYLILIILTFTILELYLRKR